MMRRNTLWGSSLAVSALLHAGLATAVLGTFAPRPVEPQNSATAEMTLATMTVQRSNATERTAQIDPATDAPLSSQGLGAGPISRTTAVATTPSTNSSTPLPTQGEPPPDMPDQRTPLSSVANPGTPATAVANRGAPAAATQPANTKVAPKQTTDQTITSLAPTAEPAVNAGARVTAVLASTPRKTTTQRAAPSKSTTLGNKAPRTTQITTAPQNATKALAAPAKGTKARATAPRPAQAPEHAPQSERAATVLAWSGTLTLDIPQGTLDTAAALRVPSAGAQGVRDALAQRLSDIDCARVQTVYNPETGAIDLRGHVRNDGDRTALMTRLSSELDGALALNDRLRRLDAPQCSVLISLADMPLPQSVEQLTNPLIIGDDLQTRTYTYTSGQTIHFDLAGADYDGWLYLDFYDGDGQVLHLVPNEYVDPLILPAETALPFGDGSPDDPARGKFQIQVTPPYGQDIAVAMVANHPLFDAPRPTVEPAGPYLRALARRVETLRQTNPGFKGEWVYLFVETRP